jgi:hypothetical protein
MKCKVTKKNSPFFTKNNLQKVLAIGLALFVVSGTVVPVQAQMFSVGGDRGPRYNTPQTEIYVGLEPMIVDYKGGGQQPEAGVFEFDGPVIRLGYNSSSFDLFMGSGGKVTGIDEASYFDVGGNIDFAVNIIRNKKLSLQLPFRIASRYTNITDDRALGISSLSRFRFGSLTGGAGARIVSRPAQNFRVEVGAVPTYGFSFASGGLFGGSLGSVSAMGRLYFDRLFNDIGLSLGYDYDLRNYDIDEDIYDYKITGHSIEIGITF